MLRVLWLSPVAVHPTQGRAGTGGWLDALAATLVRDHGVELTVVHPGSQHEPGAAWHPRFISVPSHRWRGLQTLRNAGRLPQQLLSITNEFIALSAHPSDVINPKRFDVVHVHGTEGPWLGPSADLGLPTLVSIQGVLSDCAEGFWSGMGLRERASHPRHWIRWLGMLDRARRERKLLPRFLNFGVRTRYASAFVRGLVPGARLFEDGRLLREPFYESPPREPGARRAKAPVAFSTLSEQPYKGAHHLVRAMGLPGLEGIKVRIAGIRPESSIGRSVLRLAKAGGVEERLELVGKLDATALCRCLRDADVYVHPATQENSPNAVAEAMMLGLPCVVADAGGTAEYVDGGAAGVAVPPGNSIALAAAAGSLLRDHERAASLGEAARVLAKRRHDHGRVANLILRAYAELAR